MPPEHFLVATNEARSGARTHRELAGVDCCSFGRVKGVRAVQPNNLVPLSLGMENERVDAGRDGRICLARSNSEAWVKTEKQNKTNLASSPRA